MSKKNQHEQQQAYFDKEFSRVERYTLAAWQKSYIERIKTFLLDKNFKEKTLIDIGTGTGYVAIEMAKLGMRVIACDLSRQAVENLKQYKKQFSLSTLQIIQCKAEKIPLENNSVDYIVANALLEHIPQEQKAITEWKRLLKKNGRMLVTVPLKLRYIFPFLWPINYIHDKRIGHLRRYDLASLEKKFQLEIVKTLYTGHIIKVIGIFIFLIFKSDKLATFIETLDKKEEHRRYGANNISVIFEKNER